MNASNEGRTPEWREKAFAGDQPLAVDAGAVDLEAMRRWFHSIGDPAIWLHADRLLGECERLSALLLQAREALAELADYCESQDYFVPLSVRHRARSVLASLSDLLEDPSTSSESMKET